jgi:hypothetical protein
MGGARASHNSVSRSAASDVRRRRAEQIVRFARPDILFYDEFAIGLYHRIYALYRMGEGTETNEMSHSNLAARPWIEKTSHETQFVLGNSSRNLLKKNAFAMVGAPGLEPGTR